MPSPLFDRAPVFFDLDGTLTDPKVGITHSIRHALKQLGVEAPAAEELTWCIGPPLRQSFDALVGPERASQAIAHYRERFADVGWVENEPYPNVHDVLAELVNRQLPLYVATSKPHEYASKIVEHFGLSEFFLKVFGAEMDGSRSDKAELLSFALEQTSAPEGATMIGDREHDVFGALSNSLRAVAVTYGYGSLPELEQAGAHVIVDSPLELLEIFPAS